MKNLLINLTVLLLLHTAAFCQSGGSWKGSDVPGHTFAEFTYFTGKQGFDIDVPAQSQIIRLNYTIAKTEGQLKLIIRSSSVKVLEKNVNSAEKDSLTINIRPGEKYRIYVSGKKAAGSFNIKYSAESP